MARSKNGLRDTIAVVAYGAHTPTNDGLTETVGQQGGRSSTGMRFPPRLISDTNNNLIQLFGGRWGADWIGVLGTLT